MPSPQIIEIEHKLRDYSVEDKQWLLEQLSQQVGLNSGKNDLLSSNKIQAREIIAETLSEVLKLPNDCYEEVWQKFDSACTRMSEKLDESELM